MLQKLWNAPQNRKTGFFKKLRVPATIAAAACLMAFQAAAADNTASYKPTGILIEAAVNMARPVDELSLAGFDSSVNVLPFSGVPENEPEKQDNTPEEAAEQTDENTAKTEGTAEKQEDKQEDKQDAGETAEAETGVMAATVTVPQTGYTPNFNKSVKYMGQSTVNQNLKNNATYAGKFKLTFYCACKKCCGKTNGITASGTRATEGRTIAINNAKFPMGTKVHLDGFGDFIVEDRGGMKSTTIDVFVTDHQRALQLGVYYADAYIIVE